MAEIRIACMRTDTGNIVVPASVADLLGIEKGVAPVLSIDTQTNHIAFSQSNPEQQHEPRPWYAITKWNTEDIINVAADQGVELTEAEAHHWWQSHERRFADAVVESGNELLCFIDWRDAVGGKLTQQKGAE